MRRRAFRKSIRPRSGFALLITVVLLSLMGLVLAGLARGVVQRVVAANAAAESLQERYTRRSLETVLEVAPALLDQANDQGQVDASATRVVELAEPGATTLTTDANLGERGRPALAVGSVTLRWQPGREGRTRELVVADEQAKINLNVLQRRDPQRLEQVLQDVFARGSVRVLPAPRPVEDFDRDLNRADLPAFSTFGQLVNRGDAGALFGAERFDQVVDAVTFFGNGRLRLDRASLFARDSVLSPELSAGDLVLPDLTEGERRLLRQRTTDRSSVFSVRLGPRSRNTARPGGGTLVDRSGYLLVAESGGVGEAGVPGFRALRW